MWLPIRVRSPTLTPVRSTTWWSMNAPSAISTPSSITQKCPIETRSPILAPSETAAVEATSGSASSRRQSRTASAYASRGLAAVTTFGPEAAPAAGPGAAPSGTMNRVSGLPATVAAASSDHCRTNDSVLGRGADDAETPRTSVALSSSWPSACATSANVVITAPTSS